MNTHHPEQAALPLPEVDEENRMRSAFSQCKGLRNRRFEDEVKKPCIQKMLAIMAKRMEVRRGT
jgi:hypothetical protein